MIATSSLVLLFTYRQNKMHCFLTLQALTRSESANSAEIVDGFYHPWQTEVINPAHPCGNSSWPDGGETKKNMTAHASRSNAASGLCTVLGLAKEISLS